MSSFAALTKGTVRELLRSRISILPLVLLAFALLAALLVKGGATPSEHVDVAASIIDVFAVLALLVAAAAACGQVSEEIDHGTVLLLGVRPVRRGTIIAAKLVGCWLYVTAWLVAWSAAVGAAFLVRGSGVEPAWAAVEAAALRTPVVALVVGIAVFASSLLGTRMAFGFTVMAWLVGWFSGQAHQLFEAGEPILEWVSGLAPLVAAMTYVVPIRRLEDWARAVNDTLAEGLTSATGQVLPTVYGSGADLAVGVGAIAAWMLAAGVVFRMRRSLV